MYSESGFTSLPFGLYAFSRDDDARRLLNNVELLVEDVEGHLAQVGSNGIAGYGAAAILDLTDAVETARTVVSMIKHEQAGRKN